VLRLLLERLLLELLLAGLLRLLEGLLHARDEVHREG
jgi:hypothetical protein